MSASELTVALQAAGEIAQLLQTLIQKNITLTSALMAHAAALKDAPPPGPPPPDPMPRPNQTS